MPLTGRFCLPNMLLDNNGTFKNVDPWYPAVPDYVDLAFHVSTIEKRERQIANNSHGQKQILI